MTTISELRKYFKTELSDIYSDSETALLFSYFLEKLTGFKAFHSHQKLLLQDEKKFSEIINELKTGKPYQQILGEAQFYGFTFFINENVLIPRPETEELLELAIGKIKQKNPKNDIRLSKDEDRNLKILDIGTGSGIISIILKKHFPEAEITAIDISGKALKIAKKNAKFHQTEINFVQKDYLNENLEDIFDIIISNPPYIGIDENSEIENSVKNFEPNIALFSPTSDALIFYKKIAKDIENHLSKNGMIFLEINQKLGKETLKLFQHFSESLLLKDISGNERMIFVRN